MKGSEGKVAVTLESGGFPPLRAPFNEFRGGIHDPVNTLPVKGGQRLETMVVTCGVSCHDIGLLKGPSLRNPSHPDTGERAAFGCLWLQDPASCVVYASDGLTAN